MGLRDKIAQGIEQSKSLQIEFDQRFQPRKAVRSPGNRALRPRSSCATRNRSRSASSGSPVYGISDPTIQRKLSTINNYFYSRGFLFQEISVCCFKDP